MEPQRLVGQAVNTDDHRGRYAGRLEDFAPLRDQLTVTGEHDCFGRICRDVHRDLPATVVIERLGDELPRRSLVMHGRNPRSLRGTPSRRARGLCYPRPCMSCSMRLEEALPACGRGEVGAFPANPAGGMACGV